MFIDRVYLGKRKFQSTLEGKCSIVIVIQDDNQYLKMSLFEGDSLTVAVSDASKTFTPLGHALEFVYFKDIEQIS